MRERASRKPVVRAVLGALALAAVLAGAAGGCGDDDLTVGGSLPPVPTVTEPTPTPTPDCTELGGFCVQGIDCCSGLCLFNQCQ
jgi:hypothetical protein